MNKLALTFLTAVLLTTPALAQNAGGETQPLQEQALDENAVNPATGSQSNYMTDVSIGPDGPGGLRLVRGRGPQHELFPGTVQRTVVVTNDLIYIQTVGQGYGLAGPINKLLSGPLWLYVDLGIGR
jgi:hypothetical protein